MAHYWKPGTPPKLGDWVQIRYSELRGPIVELRGPLGPGGVQIYRVRFRRKPTRAYIEVREDQLVPIPDEASPPPRRRPASKKSENP
jgi:hypothetical protein